MEVRSRKDLHNFAREHLKNPDRFPEWFNEPRTDLRGLSFRDCIQLKQWAKFDHVLDKIRTEGADNLSEIENPSSFEVIDEEGDFTQ